MGGWSASRWVGVGVGLGVGVGGIRGGCWRVWSRVMRVITWESAHFHSRRASTLIDTSRHAATSPHPANPNPNPNPNPPINHQVHLRDKPISNDIDYNELAVLTGGMSGAQIAGVANAACFIASREGRSEVGQVDLRKSIEQNRFGKVRGLVVFFVFVFVFVFVGLGLGWGLRFRSAG